ncbi:MAG TPA: MFS transporter, partial [Micromonosporaceae bacterium]
AGFRLVFTNPVLRSIITVVLGVSLLGIVPEGLAAAWADHLAPHGNARGLDQALIMMGVPIGLFIGALVIGRMVGPDRRRRLVRPLSVLVPVALGAALLNPPVLGVAAISLVVGFGVSAVMVPSNGLFAQALPTAFRARAFGVVLFGLQFVQLAGILITGLLSDHYAIHAVVGLFGLSGIAVMVLAAVTWPAPAAIDAAIESAKLANAESEAIAAAAESANSPVTTPVGANGGGGHRAGRSTSTPPAPPSAADGATNDVPLAPGQRSPSRPGGWPSPRPGGRAGHLPETTLGRASDASG